MNAPIVAGIRAKLCRKRKCFMCRGAMKDCFSSWLCPHCGSHLSTQKVCLNLCGLSAASARRFQSMLGEVNEK